MSWRTWVRATAIRLGIEEEGSVPVELALQNLAAHEDRLNELRDRLVGQMTVRQLSGEEIAAFDVARGNVYAETLVIRAGLVEMGVPSEQLPIVGVLAPLPRQTTVSVRGSALGAIRVGPSGAPRRALGGPEWAGTLGGPHTVAIIAFGLTAIGILAVGSIFVHYLTQLLNPEVALQQQIAASDIALAEAAETQAREWEETRRAAIENGVDPSTLVPPPPIDLSRMGRGNPLVQSMGAVKGIIGGLAVLAGLFIGYKVWKSTGGKRGARARREDSEEE